MGIAKLKSAYNLLIFDPRGLGCETTFQGQIGWQNLIVAIWMQVKALANKGGLSFHWIKIFIVSLM